MHKTDSDYAAITTEAAKYGYTPTSVPGIYQSVGVVVDLSATHVDWVGVIIVRTLTEKLK